MKAVLLSVSFIAAALLAPTDQPPDEPSPAMGLPAGLPTGGPEWEAYVNESLERGRLAEGQLPSLAEADYLFLFEPQGQDDLLAVPAPGLWTAREEAVELPPVIDAPPTPYEEYRDFVGPSGHEITADELSAARRALDDIGVITGVDVPLGGAANEPTIAVNPLNPLNIAAANNGGYRVTTSGGSTWTAIVLPPEPTGYSWAGDPSLAFDSQGRLFMTYLGFRTSNGGLDVMISRINPTTGAIITGPFRISTTGDTSAAGNDKEWLAADRFITSPFQDRLYVSWTEFAGGGTRVLTSYSTNQGATWSTPLQLGASSTEGFVWPTHNAVAPNGDVYVGYHSQPTFSSGAPNGTSGRIYVCRSTNGGVSFPQKNTPFAAGQSDMTYNVQTTGTGGKIPGAQFWLQGSLQPWILPDPTTSGNVYVVANDDPDNDPNTGDAANVYIARSTNNGVNWGAPIRVDDGPGTTFQVMPTAAIDDDTGCIAVHWYDNRRGARNTENRYLLDVNYTISRNGGASFGTDGQLNDELFDPDAGAPARFAGPPPTTRIGEYNGVAMADGNVYAVWTGNRGPWILDPNKPLKLYSSNTNDLYSTGRGVVFRANSATQIAGFGHYNNPGTGGSATFELWEGVNTSGNTGGTLVASATPTETGGLAWTDARFSGGPYTLKAGVAYEALVRYTFNAAQNHFFDFDPNNFGDPPFNVGPLTVIDGTAGRNTTNFVMPRLRIVPVQQMVFDTGLDECGDDCKNYQPLDCTNPAGGFYSNLNSNRNPFIRLDEFVCQETGEIEEIRFWGDGFNVSTNTRCDPNLNIDSIQIDIYSWQSAAQCQWTKNQLLCSNRIPLANFRKTPVCNGILGIVNTEFYAQLPRTCPQTQGTRYGLQIAAIVKDPNSPCIFLWSASGKIRGYPGVSIDRGTNTPNCITERDNAFQLCNRKVGSGKLLQPVNCQGGGFYSNLNNNTNPYLRVDDWICNRTGNINRIVFWGGGWDTSQSIHCDLASFCDRLQIDIYDWVAGGPCGFTLGTRRCSNQVTVASLTTSYACDNPFGGRVFRYEATLPEKCPQTLNQHYVLRIAAISRDPNSPCLFFWQPTAVVRNSPAYSIDRTDGSCTAVEPDMAWQIDTLAPPALSVTPATGYVAKGPQGGPFHPPSKVYTLENTGEEPLSWTANEAVNWLTTSPTSGSLNPGVSVNVTVATNAATDALPIGIHNATLTVTNTTNNVGNTTRPLQVNAGKKGDMNCDGVVRFSDINPFVLALSSQSDYETQYPACNYYNADCNNDGGVNFTDINPFVLLIGTD